MPSGCQGRKVAGGGWAGADQVNKGYRQAMKRERKRKREDGVPCSKEEWVARCPACRMIARREDDLRAAQAAGIVQTEQQAQAFRQQLQYKVGKAHTFGWVDPADASSTPQACPGRSYRELSSASQQQPYPAPASNAFSHPQQAEPQPQQQQQYCSAQRAQSTPNEEAVAMPLQVRMSLTVHQCTHARLHE